MTVLYLHPLFGFGIERVLSEDPDYEVVDVRSLGSEAATATEGLEVDVIVAERGDPETIHTLVSEFPPVLVVFVRLDSNLIDVYNNREMVSPPPANLAQALTAAKGSASFVTRGSPPGP